MGRGGTDPHLRFSTAFNQTLTLFVVTDIPDLQNTCLTRCAKDPYCAGVSYLLDIAGDALGHECRGLVSIGVEDG